MVVIVLEKVPRGLRGELTRWLVELDTGVFVGQLSATVRDLLWEKVTAKAGEGRCALAYSTNNEQGFAVRLSGYRDRILRDFDGISLVAVRDSEGLRKAAVLRRMAKRSEEVFDKGRSE